LPAQTDFYIDEIEMEVLHGSWPSEFSHSLDPKQTFLSRSPQVQIPGK
jgi:hypothetical protein